MKDIIIDYTPGIIRAALVEDKVLEEFSVEHASRVGIVGNIYKGKVENVLSGMKAAFVNIGLEKNGFLQMGESLVDSGRLVGGRDVAPMTVSPGDIIMCQVVKDEFGSKGARLTMDISLPGYFLVLLPNSNFVGVSRKITDPERRAYLEDVVKSVCPQNTGFIIRSAAVKASNDEIIAEANRLVSLWQNVTKTYNCAPNSSLVFQEAELLERAIRDTFSASINRVIVGEPALVPILENKVGGAKVELYTGDRNIFRHYGIDGQINALYERRVDLKNGGYLIIDKTEALTVIDVNTGKFVGGNNLEDTVFKTNLEGATEIARQLRLRNIGGIVVVDFIDMTDDTHNKAVIDKLKEELAKDRQRTSAVEMTSLGLVELTRKKTSLPIETFMLDRCKDCLDGHVVSAEQALLMLRADLVDYVVKNKADKVLVRMNPDVCDCHKDLDVFSKDKEKILSGKKIFFLKDDRLGRIEHLFETVGDINQIDKNAVLL